MSALPSFLRERSASLLALLCLFGSYVLYRLIVRTIVGYRHSKFIKENGCKPVPKYPHKDPIFGLDTFFESLRLSRTGGLLERMRERYRLVDGGVNTYSTLILGEPVITTMEPENVKAILATQFQDFNLSERRKKAFQPVFGHGIFSTDGEDWDASRALLRPCFARSLVGDLRVFESHITKMIAKIPWDGTTVDFQELFFKLTLDSGTSSLFYIRRNIH